MKEIESISNLAVCTDISLLKMQKKAYEDVIDSYCKKYPLFSAIRYQASHDDDFWKFMALYTASATLTARINELEKNNETA